MVILLNSDIDLNSNELSTLVGQAVTKVIAPKNVFFFSAGGQKKPAS